MCYTVTVTCNGILDQEFGWYDGNDVDIIYLDFYEAFDCVPHQRLLSKLKAYGIFGNVEF